MITLIFATVMPGFVLYCRHSSFRLCQNTIMNNMHNALALDNIKRLWKKYSTTFITVVCVVCVVIVGWQYWQKKQLQSSIEAAQLYQKLFIVIENASTNTNAIISQAEYIISLYPDSIYADFAHLAIAKQAASQNDLIKAKQSLQQLTSHSKNVNLQALATLRIARIDIAENNPQPAITILNSLSTPGYTLSKDMLLGDAYLAQKDFVKAKQHWQEALKQTEGKFDLTQFKNMLEMKINNLAALHSTTH